MIVPPNCVDQLKVPGLTRAIRMNLSVASDILGERTISPAEVATVWGDDTQTGYVPIPYSEATLRRAAKDNQEGDASWWLVYAAPLSPLEQRARMGTDTSNPPSWKHSSFWFSEPAIWASFAPSAGYYLLDFGPEGEGRFHAHAWESQGDAINSLGLGARRAHEAIVSQVVFSVLGVRGERLLRRCYHWGYYLVGHNSMAICAGQFDNKGWTLGLSPVNSDRNENLGVVLTI